MESLGYGTQFTVDGFQAAQKHLAEPETLQQLLQLIADQLEPCNVNPLEAMVVNTDGVSAALLSCESQLLLHAFPAARAVTLQVFTRRDLPLSGLMSLMRERLSAGRFESHLGNVSKVAPTVRVELERM